MEKIRFTKFINKKGNLCKKFLRVDGKLVKEPEPRLAQGEFVTIDIPWSDFPQYLTSLKLNEAISNVVCAKPNGSGPLRSGKVVRRAQEGNPRFKNAVARTAENFVQHSEKCDIAYNYFFIDIDNMVRFENEGINLTPPPGLDDDGLSDWLENTQDQIVATLLADIPELKNLPDGCVSYPSAGAMIFDEQGNCLRGLTGVHIYFLLPVTYKVEELRDYIQARLWLGGHGYFKPSRTGSLLERTYVDAAVMSRNRLDFIAGATCAEGLTQRRGAPVVMSWKGSGVLDLSFDPDELRQIKERVRNSDSVRKAQAKALQAATSHIMARDNVSRKEAEKILGKLGRKLLPGSVTLYYDDGTRAPAWHILLEPGQYHKKTCADPLEPESGRCKCQVYYNDNGSIVLHSFKHGGYTMSIVWDFTAAREVIEKMSEETLVEKLGTEWMKLFSAETISNSEREQLFETLKRVRKARGDSGNIKELKSKFDMACEEESRSELEQVLHEMNQKYAVLFQGGRQRVMYEKKLPWGDGRSYWAIEYMQPSNLYLKCNKYQVFQWKNGAKKQVDVAKAWLNWEKRKDYEGLLFAPDTAEREVEINGQWFFNLFKGYGAARVSVGQRKCRGRNCGGKGCVDWFFNQEGWKTVEDDYVGWGCGSEEAVAGAGADVNAGAGAGVAECGSVLWWCRNLYENIAAGEIVLAKWILDWIADLIQHPGVRPGTALAAIGGQGTGKGLFIKPIMQLLNEHSCHISNMQDIVGRFNAHLEGTLLIYADEATYGGSKEMANTLKALVTEDMIQIEKKGVDKYTVKNNLRLYISSNNDWVVPADLDERRYCIVRVAGVRAQDKKYFAKVATCELGELLDDLKRAEIKSDLKTAPETSELKNQKMQNLSLEQEFMAMLAEWILDGMPGEAEEEMRVKQKIMRGEKARFKLLYDLMCVWLRGSHELRYTSPRKLTQRVLPLFDVDGSMRWDRAKVQEDASVHRAWSLVEPETWAETVLEKLGVS